MNGPFYAHARRKNLILAALRIRGIYSNYCSGGNSFPFFTNLAGRNWPAMVRQRALV